MYGQQVTAQVRKLTSLLPGGAPLHGTWLRERMEKMEENVLFKKVGRNENDPRN